MSGWRPALIRIETMLGHADVRGYVSDDAPGLSVTPVRETAGLWAVTHVPSGRRAAQCSGDAENVMGYALALAKAGDWNRPVDHVKAHASLWSAAVTLARQVEKSDEYVVIPGPGDRLSCAAEDR
jgi:hypothetical protein